MDCRQCKTPVGKDSDWKDYKCNGCDFVLCRRCDDTSNFLNWTEVGEKDYYLCRDCVATIHLKKSVPVRVEGKRATADSAYTHTPSVPFSSSP